jgi:hypothetical protein
MTQQVIGVTYLYLPQENAWHLALFYDDGAGKKQVIEVAPQNNFPDRLSIGQVAAEIAKELWSLTNENDGSPFGLIVGAAQGFRGWNEFNANDDARPKETLLQDDNLSSIWNGIVADAAQKIAAGYEYRPVQQNSNTFVGTLLRDAQGAGIDIRMPTGQPIGISFIPGLQNILHDPIGQRSDLPSSLGATDFAFSNPDPNTTSIVVGDPTFVTVQWESGQVDVTVNGQASTFEPYAVTSVTAADGHVVLIGSSEGVTFDAHGSDSLMLGGPGDDTFLLGYGGNDWIDGGSGNNQVICSKSTDSYTVTLSASNSVDGGSNDQIIQVRDNATGGVDKITSVQSIRLGTSDNNIVAVKLLDGLPKPKDATTIDLGATLYSSNDTLDFSQYGKNVYLGTTTSADGKGEAVGLYTDENMTASTGLSFSGMTILNLGGGNNKIDISMAADPYLHTINMGGGNNTISSSVVNLTINLGDGNDIVKSTGPGSIVKVGSGVDKIEASHNGQLLIENANTSDQITYYGSTLHGGVRWGGSESVYAYGIHGERYGRNKQGDLVILDQTGNETFIPGFNFGTDGTNRTAGLEVLEISFKLARSNMWTSGFETAASILCALEKAGEALLGWKPSGVKDPLVLDLTGGGISLSAQEASGVSFDINNDGFASGVGWTDSSGGNGFLVRDLNGNEAAERDGLAPLPMLIDTPPSLDGGQAVAFDREPELV